MALDTITINKLIDELKRELINSRIDKVHQPEKDEILLNIKSRTNSYKLVISANSSQPRIHFTKVQKENPKTAPLFCMLLRKHLQSGRVTEIKQIDFERIIRFSIESYNEFGDLTTKYLFCEIMGRNSNIILTKEDLTIIDCIKHIDFSISTVRQLLPGLIYSPPPAQNKTPILCEEINSISLDFKSIGQTPEKEIMANISGISPLISREIVARATGKNNLDCSELNDDIRQKINAELRKIGTEKTNPCVIYEKTSGKIIDFSPIDIFQYSEFAEKRYFESINEMLDDYFFERDSMERMKQKSAFLVHLLNTNIDRTAKKISILKKTLDDAKKKEDYKIKGDLLTANLYAFSQGDKEVKVQNYYSENYDEILIELNPTLTPSQNSQRYYKLYQKAKNAEIESEKQLQNALSDLEYLESTLMLVNNSSTEADLIEIRSELADLGYIVKQKKKGKSEKSASKPHHYISSDGFDIYVGKNNTQNDYLTLRFANSQDMWFHTKKIHGSHTIIKLGVDKDIPPTTIKEAAELAAYYSKGRESTNVPVDYTLIKNVKKPNGAKPGMVIYDFYNTIYVTPNTPSIEKIN
ncbi:MAG: NFACT family protein [Clostridia bacterium]|nr:NFACT family protein [Clostridia bacterium]